MLGFTSCFTIAERPPKKEILDLIEIFQTSFISIRPDRNIEYFTFVILGVRGTGDTDLSLDHVFFWPLARLLHELVFLLLRRGLLGLQPALPARFGRLGQPTHLPAEGLKDLDGSRLHLEALPLLAAKLVGQGGPVEGQHVELFILR